MGRRNRQHKATVRVWNCRRQEEKLEIGFVVKIEVRALVWQRKMELRGREMMNLGNFKVGPLFILRAQCGFAQHFESLCETEGLQFQTSTEIFQN